MMDTNIDDTDIEIIDISDIFGSETPKNIISLPPHQRCASHILHLIASHDCWAKENENTAAQRMYGTVMTKLKTWWRQQNKSSVVAEFIKNNIGVYLITPVKTRWNSEYNAIAQICNIIDSNPGGLQTAAEKGGLPVLLTEEIQFPREYIWVTQPIAFALELLQKEKYMYMGYLLPTIMGLKRSLESKKEMNGRPLKFCATILQNMIEALMSPRRFHCFPNDEQLILSTCLLPQFKFNWDCVQDFQQQEIFHRKLLRQMEHIHAPKYMAPKEYATSTVSVDCAKEAEFLGISSPSKIPQYETCSEELDRFLRCKNDITIAECYGTQNNQPFQRLRILFLKHNTGLPSSASVERLFSLVNAVFRSDRANLSDQRLEQQAMMAANKLNSFVI